MIITTKTAFDFFMKNIVNLDSSTVSNARKSRDNLLEKIQGFSGTDDFFDLCSDFNVHFGSFARKTKCRELDDIDLMIGISANGATYNSFDNWDEVRINANQKEQIQVDCMNDDGTLNSTKVINKFKEKLKSVNDYSRSELHKNGEAVTLTLKSRVWNFDIVPCFYTVKEFNGRSYYLIPNGKGNWKKTDPTIDREYVKQANKNSNGHILELIRLCKKWNTVKNVKTMPSYLLETMIINFIESHKPTDNDIKMLFKKTLDYIAAGIWSPVCDMKKIEGDINTIKSNDRQNICEKARTDFEKVKQAIIYDEILNSQEDAIKIWGEIFGGDFPKYGQ